jgi:DNA-binding NtrC family response regulator
MAVKRRKLREETAQATEVGTRSKGKGKSESARVRALLEKFRTKRDAAFEEALEEMAGSAELLENEPVRLSKGVRSSLYREVSGATKAAYRRKAYKPKKTSLYRRKLHQARKEIVEDALRAAGGNVTRAARHLEINPDTVYEAISA